MDDLPSSGNVGSAGSRSFLDIATNLAGIAANVAGAVRGSSGNGTEPTVRAPQATAPQPPSNFILYIALGVAALIGLFVVLRK